MKKMDVIKVEGKRQDIVIMMLARGLETLVSGMFIKQEELIVVWH